MPRSNRHGCQSGGSRCNPQYRSSGKVVFWLVPILVLVIAVGFWLTRSTVELSQDHYATAIALYRVCNQRSTEGLQQIETMMQSVQPAPDPSDPSVEAIRSIMAQAKVDRWEAAAKECRSLLDDQIQR